MNKYNQWIKDGRIGEYIPVTKEEKKLFGKRIIIKIEKEIVNREKHIMILNILQ